MSDQEELDTTEGGIENVMGQIETGQDETAGPQEYPPQVFQKERIVSPDPNSGLVDESDVAEQEGSSDDRPQLPARDTDGN